MTARINARDFARIAAQPGKRRSLETPLHRQIVNWLRWQLPKAVLHHSPNELDMPGKDAARLVAKAKSMGMRPGWPDIEFMLNGRMYFMEVKAGNNRPSPEQKKVHDELRAQGAFVAVVTSLDEAQAAVRRWGILPT